MPDASFLSYQVARLRSSPRLAIHTGRPFEPFSGP